MHWTYNLAIFECLIITLCFMILIVNTIKWYVAKQEVKNE